MSNSNLWLGIETSCDDTACAVLLEKDGSCGCAEILSNELYSQIDEHKAWGGVVPELASRAHLEKIVPVVEAALQKAKEKAGVELSDIGQIAFTRCPGLMGSLLVGANFAAGFAKDLGIPAYGVHHLEGHIAAAILNSFSPKNSLSKSTFNSTGSFDKMAVEKNLSTDAVKGAVFSPPFVALIVSGGHTELVLCKPNFEYESLGRTRDDAAGEAFDKCGKIMGLGYPAGVEISKLAESGNPHFCEFPRALMGNSSSLRTAGSAAIQKEDFSFSGLKTAVSRYIQTQGEEFVKKNLSNICASLQEAIADILSLKAVAAAERAGVENIVLCGGVSANNRLRELLQERSSKKGITLAYPEKKLCTDNGAMIAYAAILRKRAGMLEVGGQVKAWSPLA